MYHKDNKATGNKDFVVGQVKKEVKKVRAFANRTMRMPDQYSNQSNSITTRRICAPIPPNQDALAAEARGEKEEKTYFDSILMVRVI